MPQPRKLRGNSEVARKTMRYNDIKKSAKSPKRLNGTKVLNDDMKKLLLAFGVAQKPKPKKVMKMAKPNAKKNVKKGAY